MSVILDGRALSYQLKESMRDKVRTLFFSKRETSNPSSRFSGQQSGQSDLRKE